MRSAQALAAMWGRDFVLPDDIKYLVMPVLAHRLILTNEERLRKQFPSFNEEIGGIVDAFNLSVYGEMDLDEDLMTRARHSWKKLRSPRYWPTRLKSWFFQGKR